MHQLVNRTGPHSAPAFAPVGDGERLGCAVAMLQLRDMVLRAAARYNLPIRWLPDRLAEQNFNIEEPPTRASPWVKVSSRSFRVEGLGINTMEDECTTSDSPCPGEQPEVHVCAGVTCNTPAMAVSGVNRWVAPCTGADGPCGKAAAVSGRQPRPHTGQCCRGVFRHFPFLDLLFAELAAMHSHM